MDIRPVVKPIGPSIAYLQLTQGQFTLIDLEDADDVGRWNWFAQWVPLSLNFRCARHEWLAETKSCKKINLHSYIVPPGEGFEIDHKDRNPLNNHRYLNLRKATRIQNDANRSMKNVCGYKGVRKLTPSGRFEARIGTPPNRVSLGTADSAQEAYALYCAEAKRRHGEFALRD